MDALLAGLFVISSFGDMALNYCPDACLARAEEEPRIALSYGGVQFQEDFVAREAYARYSFPLRYGPVQPVLGVALAEDGSAWVGAGGAWTAHAPGDWGYVQFSLMPGLHHEGAGPRLGQSLEFRSGIELGVESPGGIRYAISFDHRSNADLSPVNPGLETLQFRVSIPLD
ncbi:acyloxyacyl hydrolase [Pseudoroseicyclus tamaricis]|uniref:Acyloxyacyl hydrolase n=1 Tax=Pseudoroseicyclus tamaricis TaxID=2705421 RepID=A0A6B2K5X3_9RHOB|nr:acyloxyacyl hydrolase [Pseudoroseicyclus tamaricis]NDV02216.1 acyloxyacyl hydrolase [Pseudoroseicyclus tamaricis]